MAFASPDPTSRSAVCVSMPQNLLLDPYAKAIAGDVNWADEMFGYVVGDKLEDLAQDFRDDAWGMPKSVVIDPAFDWGNDRHPEHAVVGIDHLRNSR